ncbi:MAG: hypothetical protein U9O96_08200 [Candidatus Thermoplasmatota archaeon]|nr:hypothetical protein [Candidatus Thermoplasmatota archaeon]
MCLHTSCGSEERVWLPLRNDEKSEVALHPWCTKCGTVKNISSDKAKKMGYWTNILARISQRFNVAQAQKRLAAKELEAYDGFDDVYSLTGSSQQKIFVEVVKKYFNLREKTIYSFL